MNRKIIFTIIIFLTCLSICIIVEAKYISEEQIEIATLNIDRTRPIIELLGIENNNKGYENYANSTHTIKIKVKVKEKNIGNDTLENKEIVIKVGDKTIELKDKKIKELKRENDEIIYEIELNKISENGLLILEIEEGAITDTAGWQSNELKIETKILIDNIKPDAKFIEEEIENGKVNRNDKC